ncbi:MAG: hypothetical protein Q9166_004948 [cf. Caloplaca sp. 2 TL-2023]
MSPSLMSSSGPSPETSVAFTRTERTPTMHHSTSTPQMHPRSFDDYPGQSSSHYMSGPSAFRTPGDLTAPGPLGAIGPTSSNSAAKEENIRLSNISKMTESSYGSPSRFVGKSPNPRDQPSYRVPCPQDLGLGNIGDSLQAHSDAGPKSAPANVKSFDQRAREESIRLWDNQNFDDRWHQRSEEMPSVASTTASRQNPTHLDLLHAQFGHPGLPSHTQDQTSTTPQFSGISGLEAASNMFEGRGYEDLTRYVAVASSGQQLTQVPELERLMATMLNLRGENNILMSVDQSGRDVLRKYMYQQTFDCEDGSSRLSRENPNELIDVAGYLMAREALHNQIVFFLEDKLEEMIRSPSPRPGTQQAAAAAANDYYQSSSARQHLATDSSNTGHRGIDYQATGIEEYGNPIGRNSAVQPSTLDPRLPGPVHTSSPVPGFDALSLGHPHGATNQVWTGSGLTEVPNLNNQVHYSGQFGLAPAAPQFGHYGQPAPPGVAGQQGLMYGPAYMPPQVAPGVPYFPSRPTVPIMTPYGVQYVPSQGYGIPQYPPINPYQQQPSPWMHQASIPQWARQPAYFGSVIGTTKRASSPMVHTRTGRTVVPEVALLPYRAGSDDMYPHGQQGGSVQYQELTRNGGPTYEAATRAEVLPFIENARNSKPAEWGVLRIGNIPYTLTKQEVLGFLGRNAKIVTPEYGVAIHIIMDRPTGKTMDCYVEFFSYGDAQAALNKCLMRGSQLRLGERVVDVHMSSQDELMKELFPRAKNCIWEHGRPRITESNEPYNTGFKSFVTNEELLQMVTWADKPHRFPWFCIDRITIKTRDEMFRSTLSLVNILMNELNRANEKFVPHISETLLIDLLYAGLNVPAFSEQQRWLLRKAASTSGAKKYALLLQSHPANTSTDTAFGEWEAWSPEALKLETIGQIGSYEMEMLLRMLRDVLPESL